MYIAQRNIQLSGKLYAAGESIPKEAVIPSRVTALLNSHYIVEQRERNIANTEEKIDMDTAKISVNLNKSNLGLFLNAYEVQAIFDILQMNVEEGAEAVMQQDDENILLTVKDLDTRKGMKTAAENRLKSIEAGDEENDV